MKYFLSVISMALFLSSCSTNMHIVRKGKLDTPLKESYVITYRAALSDYKSAKVKYRDENGKLQSVKDIPANWEKVVSLKPGSDAFIKMTVKGDKAKGDFKVLADGKIIDAQTLTGRKLFYSLDFILP